MILTLKALLSTRPVYQVECARFAQQGLKSIAYPGSGLPRGYFCSVTPP